MPLSIPEKQPAKAARRTPAADPFANCPPPGIRPGGTPYRPAGGTQKLPVTPRNRFFACLASHLITRMSS